MIHFGVTLELIVYKNVSLHSELDFNYDHEFCLAQLSSTKTTIKKKKKIPLIGYIKSQAPPSCVFAYSIMYGTFIYSLYNCI